MEVPRIVRIELTRLFVPFHQIVREVMKAGQGGLGMAIPAEEEWTGGDFVICQLTAEDGNTGVGEAFVWLPETGISSVQVIDVIEHALARYVLGESPFNVERIRQRMEANVARGEVPKGLLDMACYDLMGRICGRPVCELIGGRNTERVPWCALIPLMDLDSMMLMARGFVEAGTSTLRIKLGRGVTEDALIMERMRAELGDKVRLRVDYNQAYSPVEAVRAIKAIEPFVIDYAEQPVAARDWLGLAWVQERVDVPLMAHEGCFSLTDITALVELGAVRVIGINSERPGGVTNALRAISYAEQRGLGVALHNQPLGIASAMHIHLHAARYSAITHATELFGHVMLEDDLITEPLIYREGFAHVPTGPGWGVDLDLAALDKYATAKTVRLEI